MMENILVVLYIPSPYPITSWKILKPSKLGFTVGCVELQYTMDEYLT